MSKQMVSKADSWIFDFWFAKIGDLEKEVQRLKNRYGEEAKIEPSEKVYSQEHLIRYERLETDEEYEKRLAKEKRIREQKQAEKIKKEEKERREYERLKKKFEG